MNPTLHLTNWSSRKRYGPGRLLTIMANPRTWEHGAGTVTELVPRRDWLEDVRSGAMSFEAYAEQLAALWEMRLPALGPGVLRVEQTDPPTVANGDTLCCACARGAPCHRRVAAPFLVRAGWRVILDGVEVP